MSFKIKLKSDKFTDPTKASLDLRDSQADRIALRDGIDDIATTLDAKSIIADKGILSDLRDLEDIISNSLTENDVEDMIEDSVSKLMKEIENLHTKIDKLHMNPNPKKGWFKRFLEFIFG